MNNNFHKKGFTLIELIVVVAILGLLVLLAAPKFLGQIGDAREIQIKNDIRAYENAVQAQLVENENFISTLTPLDEHYKNEINSSKKLLDRNLNVKELSGGEFYIIPDLNVKSSLPGLFIADNEASVYYYDKSGKIDENIEDENENKDEDSNENIEEEEKVDDGTVDGIPVTPEEMFTWKSSSDTRAYKNKNNQSGYFRYTGTNQSVVNIPHEIDGVKITSYYKMFSELENSEVEKIVSSNKTVTSTESMFYMSTFDNLDLSKLETSNVERMVQMFDSANISSLNLNGMDTRNAKDINGMFYKATIPKIDLTYFDTTNVTTMNIRWSGNSNGIDVGTSFTGTGKGMFDESITDEIIFGPNFKAQKVPSLSGMFRSSTVKRIYGLENLENTLVWDMSQMFSKAENIQNLDLSKLKTPSVTTMKRMFSQHQADVLDLSGLDTSNVVNMEGMFEMSSIREYVFEKDGVSTKWDTSNVQDMEKMFNSAKLKDITSNVPKIIDISSFDISNVTDMRNMFASVVGTKVILGENNNNNPSGLNMNKMFQSSNTKEIDMRNFDLSNIPLGNMDYMFSITSATDVIARSEDVTKIQSTLDFRSARVTVKTQ